MYMYMYISLSLYIYIYMCPGPNPFRPRDRDPEALSLKPQPLWLRPLNLLNLVFESVVCSCDCLVYWCICVFRHLSLLNP